ncbi:MAG: prolipoprotein diacylglyceryl transferase [Deltaproteobacteria bacterium]|nr:prolipoprotein diacylglyceryl transferase [Deltaproteobacteria bacterium]
MHPVIFSLGPITVYSFGVMLALGFLAAGNVLGRELERKGIDPELASSMVLWAAVGGLGGSRLLSIAEDWQGFVAHPLSFVFTGAGFVFYGGLLGGFLTVSIFIRSRGLSWLRVSDSIAPGLAIGQAIGRIGCLLAGDGDWGMPTTLPWGMRYPNAIIGWESWIRANGLPLDVRVHPAPIYETLGYGAVFVVLWSMRRSHQPDGMILWWYLLLSGTVRFLVEFVRINPKISLGLTEAQWISLGLIAIATVLIWRWTDTERVPAAARVGSTGPPAA